MSINRILSLILFLALMLRLGVAFFLKEPVSFDAAGYDYRAISVVKGRGFADENGATAFKEPFYSFFLAGIYYFFGHNYLIVRIVQAIFGTLVCLFIYLISKRLFNSSVALLSVSIAAVNPALIKCAGQITTEGFYTLLLITSIYLVVKLVSWPVMRDSCFLGLTLGFGALTRSVLMPFVFVVCLFLFFRIRKCNIKRYFVVAVISISFLIVVMPWTLRNWFRFREFIPISTNIGVNMYSSYFPPQGKLFGFTANDDNTKYAQSIKSEAGRSRFLLKKTLERLHEFKPKDIARLELLKALYFWCPFDWEVIGGGRYNAIYAFILPFFVAGVFWTISSFTLLFPIYLPIIYAFSVALITYGSPRFRLSIEPYIIMIGSAGIIYFIKRYPNKILVPLFIIFILLVNILFSVNYYQIKASVVTFLKGVGIW